MKKNNYWKQRRKKEREWQKRQIELDTDFDKITAKRYKQAVNDINDLIDLQISNVSARTHTNYAEMMKAITSRDVERWGKEAKSLVERAKGIRKSGKKVTSKNFTAEESQRMKLYNATMRINRLEYLKSMVGAYLTHLTMDISEELREKLTNDAIAEQKRQAGLLGKFLPDYDFKQNYDTTELIMQSTANATWSERLWRNQDVLKARLDSVLTTGFITGEHPRVLARKLRNQVSETVKNQIYVTERLARTESARIQYDVQFHAIKDNGFKFVWYFAEPKACDICQKYADHKYPGEDELGVFKLDNAPKIPVHPNCRCSIGSYMSNAEVNDAIDRAKNIKRKPDYSDTGKFYSTEDFHNYQSNGVEEDRYNKTSTSWYNKLSEGEQAAVQEYISDDMSELNGWLAGGRDFTNVSGWEHAPTEYISEQNNLKQKETDNLNSALSKFRRSENIVVTRIMSHEEYVELLMQARDEGVHTFKRFKSTTPFKGEFNGIRENEPIKYYVPAGVKGAYFGKDVSKYPEEKEFLIAEGQKYRARFTEERGLTVYVYSDS